MNENEVVSAIKTGSTNQEVFDWFFKSFYETTVKLSRQFGIATSDGVSLLVEVTGDTILKISTGKFPEGANLGAYLYRALYNQMCNRLRTKSRHNLSELDANSQQFSVIPEEEIDEEKEEMIALLYRCVEKLPPGEREPLRLWHLEERTYDEISVLLKIAKKSAKTLVNRGMAKLRTCMSNKLTQQQ